MAIIPSTTRFIGISPSVDLTEKKSALINSKTEPYTMQDIIESIPDSSGVATVVAGTNVTVDSTDPLNPIVNVPVVGAVATVVAGDGVSVDSTDPANPIVSSHKVLAGKFSQQAGVLALNITRNDFSSDTSLVSTYVGQGTNAFYFPSGTLPFLSDSSIIFDFMTPANNSPVNLGVYSASTQGANQLTVYERDLTGAAYNGLLNNIEFKLVYFK